MESESPSPQSVNWFDSENEEKSSGNSPSTGNQSGRRIAVELLDRRTFQNYLRILGWINGVWKKAHQRTEFYDWDAAAFSRATGRKGGKKIPVRTLERVFPKFQVWCQEYYFTKLNVGGRWIVRITRNPYVRNIGGNMVRDRLLARIRRHVEKAGRIKVDAEWCRKFSEISRLSLNSVEHAWQSLKKFEGLKLRWRGRGQGRKLCIEAKERWAQICAEQTAAKAARKNQKFDSSDPQTSPPVSISFGNDKIQSSGPLRGRFPEESARAAPATALPGDISGRAGEGGAEPGGCDPPGIRPYFGRWFPGRAPLQICNRLVLPQNLRGKAAWIAKARLENLHAEFPRVHWLFPHARNFAFQALSFGYQTPAIETAWRSGLAKSHADSIDAGESRDDPTRPPSAAKVYAMVALRAADPRPPEILWAEFFSGSGRRASDLAVPAAEVSEALTPRRVRKNPDADSAMVSKLAELRAKISQYVKPDRVNDRPDDEPKQPAPTLGELRVACEKIGISIGTFNGLPWANKKAIIDRILATRQK